MNKTEKIICILLGAVLAWYVFTMKNNAGTNNAAAQRVSAETQRSAEANNAEAQSGVVASGRERDKTLLAEETQSVRSVPETPEEIVVLENDELRLELSSWGGVIKKATLKKYAKGPGPVSEDNPAVVFDFAKSPLGQLGEALQGYSIATRGDTEVVFVNGENVRKVSLGKNYLVRYDDVLSGKRETTLSLGLMTMGSSKADLLSVDSWALDAGKGQEGVIHHCEGDSPLKGYLVGGLSGGCSGSKSAAGLPVSSAVAYPGAQKWIALKNRFFVTALVSSTARNKGFDAVIARDTAVSSYRPESVSAQAVFDLGEASGPKEMTSVFYVGPKKQALLWDLGMKDVMEFGMWRWICYPLVKVLNVFYAAVPNYGVAIILLTILVRLLFWPLTHKSTVGMKKMQEIQPLMKEIQAKYKDNPQRMQQETFALYRQHKVNPMSSCLPMLVQIPVFIALFNVLRSAVELRYAPFLWIGDLSQPEGLFASWFPFGGLNILPILMALTMGLQSALTPSTGDKSQQKMMVVFMPVMMLFMFYSFPSALSLYWTLSQVVSIVQMWLIRRQTRAQQGAVEVIDPPKTRQMRRHG